MAEQLFGRHGIEGVSLRQINVAAGLANKSAVHYHFGDRAELVRAIWRYRLPQLTARRMTLIHQAGERGTLNDPHTLLSIVVQPIHEIVDETGYRCFAAFSRHAIRASIAAELPDSILVEDPSLGIALGEVVKLGAKLRPALTRDVAWYRVRYAISAFFDMEFERGHAPPLGMPRSEADFFADGIRMMVAMCFR
ncbi:MAG: TetR/AcrR family transcriptional regulator [Gammaproteobacteria bacterium]